MKKYILIFYFIAFSSIGFSQNSQENGGLLVSLNPSEEPQLFAKDFLISFGVNFINSDGKGIPFGNVSNWSAVNPIFITLETQVSRNFAVEVAFSSNKLNEGTNRDGGLFREDQNYFAIDANALYYVDQFIVPNLSWLELYTGGGLGYFSLEGENVSFNLGGGGLAWLNSNKTFGLKAQVMAKFAVSDSATENFNNNHFQYGLQAVVRF